VQEPLAYPASTIALWLILRAVLRPARGSVAWAIVAALLAAAVRPQLASLVATLVLSLLIVGWRSASMRRWRAAWSRWDWVGAFGWYAALKGAYVSTVLASDIVERNLIYLDPLLFVGLAVLIVKRGTRWWWALASGTFTLYMLAHLPYRPGLDSYPYYEAHGL